MATGMPRLVIIRHGVTEWSKSGNHTGRTDLPLLPEGEMEAQMFGTRLVGLSPDNVVRLQDVGRILRSPRQRCAHTLEFIFGKEEERKRIGLPDVEVCDNVREWDYGAYEGKKTKEIRETFDPNWEIFHHGTPDHPSDPNLPGESVQHIGDRADAVVEEIKQYHKCEKKDVVVVTHGHFSIVLIARFLGLPVKLGRSFLMSTTGSAVLSYHHRSFEEPVLIGFFSPGMHPSPTCGIDFSKRSEEYQYLELVANVIRFGEVRQDRTGTGTKALFAPRHPLKFSLRNNMLPLLTTKRVFYRGVLEELLWFIAGRTDSKWLSDRNVHIWDGNGSLDFLKKRGLGHRREGDLGPVYGFQWRHFGATYVDADTDYHGQGTDQLAQVIHQIKTNPTDRRILLSAWNPADLDKMALPPCHILCQFFVSLPSEAEKARGEKPRLSCQMYQRSCDLGLGVPFNIASYSLLTHFIAAVTGCTAEEFSLVMGDAHVYLDHVEPLQKQLLREPRGFPKIRWCRDVHSIDDIRAEDIELLDYAPHGKLDMRMSV